MGLDEAGEVARMIAQEDYDVLQLVMSLMDPTPSSSTLLTVKPHSCAVIQ